MRRYTRRPRVVSPRSLGFVPVTSIPDNGINDDDDLGYERPYHHVEVTGERQPYWCGLYDHRGDEIWVTERRQLGFIQDDDDDDQDG